MNAVVHIGHPKTGTTSIQNLLQENRIALAAQGFFYKRYSTRKNHSEFVMATLHHMGKTIVDRNLRSALRAKDLPTQARRVASLERRFDKDLAGCGCHTTLISCELLGLPRRGADFISTFHNWLQQRFTDVTYVLYIREQDKWLESEYSQHIRNGGTMRFQDFQSACSVPNFNQMVERWERVVGRDRIVVRLFDRYSLKNGDVINDFCAVARIDIDRLVRPRSLNEKLTVRHAEAARRGNAVVACFFGPGIASRILRRIIRFTLFSVIPPGSEHLELMYEKRETIRAQVHESNEALRKRRFPDRQRLFS